MIAATGRPVPQCATGIDGVRLTGSDPWGYGVGWSGRGKGRADIAAENKSAPWEVGPANTDGKPTDV
jgi:hypothetical protein